MNKYDLATLRILEDIVADYWKRFYTASMRGSDLYSQQIFIESQPYRLQLYYLLKNAPEQSEVSEELKVAGEIYNGNIKRIFGEELEKYLEGEF